MGDSFLIECFQHFGVVEKLDNYKNRVILEQWESQHIDWLYSPEQQYDIWWWKRIENNVTLGKDQELYKRKKSTSWNGMRVKMSENVIKLEQRKGKSSLVNGPQGGCWL